MKKLFQIEPEQPIQTAEPFLYLRIGEKHCSFAIVDNASQSLKKLGYYTAENISESSLDELTSSDLDINKAFHRTIICYDHTENFLLPAELSSSDIKEQLFRRSVIVGDIADMIEEPVKKQEIQNSYHIPASIHQWLTKQFKGVSYIHQDTVLLNGIDGADEKGLLIVDFRKEDFILLAAKNKKVLLCQVYEYNMPADVLFYLLKVCSIFSLRQQEVSLQLSGLIDKDSVLYKELYQYFINISFRDTTWNMPVNEYPAHFFTSLNDLALCAS